MASDAPPMAGPSPHLSRIYSPAIILWELGVENGLFRPILPLAQKGPELTPQSGHTSAGAKQRTPYTSSTNVLEALCNLVPADSLASWRHRDAKIGKFGHLGWPTRVGFCGDLVKPNLDSRASVFLWSRASGFGLVSHWLLAVSRGDGRAMGQRAAEKAKLCNVARTVSSITVSRLEQQIQNSRAIDRWSYATRIATLSWLGPLPHGDMVSPTWPQMAKKAKISRNGSHSRSHISILMASKNLTKVGIDTWDLNPNICPISALEVASNHFSL